MKKIAILVCLAMLISMFVVTASAAEVVTSNVDFTTMDVAAAGDDTKAAMEAAGLIIPEGSSWEITDHFYHVAMPAGGFAPHSYIQVLEAGEGKTFAGNVNLNYAYMLAAEPENPEWTPGSVTVEVSTDGTNYTKAYEDKEGVGKEGTADVVKMGDIALEGTAGASKVWVKVTVDRHGGAGAGSIGWTKISGTAAKEGEISSTADFTTLTPAAAGAESNAAMEALGVTVPEGSDWHIVDHFSVCIIPKEGYQRTFYIQTLDAGEGKVLSEDASFKLSYAMAHLNHNLETGETSEYDVGWFVVYVSTDGENYSEVWVNEEGQGKMYDVSAFAEETIPLTGTAGASKVWVKVEVERHSGETSGLVKTSTITGVTKAASGTDSDETGDMIGIVVALLAVSGMGITVLKKKEN